MVLGLGLWCMVHGACVGAWPCLGVGARANARIGARAGARARARVGARLGGRG